MTLTQLNYFITISAAHSMNKAAEQLYVSQPSLTSAIQELEKELEVTLFYRSGHGVTLTNDGAEFLKYAKQLYSQYEQILEKYGKNGTLKKKFGVSAQHYSFAVKAFANMAREFDMAEYEFAIRETRTLEVITDVATLRSEIGVLYLCDFNRQSIKKLLNGNGLEFHHLIDCRPYVYLWKGHPLANEESIRFEQLKEYPCLSFEQGEGASFYLAEEILATDEYPRIIKANDRATMLNLMVALNGYTLCSGIICGELNGNSYRAVPFSETEADPAGMMEVGYIMKKNIKPSYVGEKYVEALKAYLKTENDA